MKSKKSAGYDSISILLLKDLKAEICYPLSDLINQSLLTGIVPKCMKIAKVVPVCKSKDKNVLTNYRPISILPSIIQKYLSVSYNRLLSFLNLNGSLYQSQYGFRLGHSTVHATSELYLKFLILLKRTRTLLAFS